METKWCSGCKADLDVKCFRKRIDKNRKEPFYPSQCLKCENEYAAARRVAKAVDMTEIRKRHYATHKNYYRDKRIERFARLVGVPFEPLKEYALSHSGCCDICGQACITGNSLAIDHDHVSGNIRGLLCQQCNLGLGKFNDDLALLQKAVVYLSRNPVLLSKGVA